MNLNLVALKLSLLMAVNQMHTVKWNKDICKTYHDVCVQYIFTLKKFHAEKNTRKSGIRWLWIPREYEKEWRGTPYQKINPQFQIFESTSVYGNQDHLFGDAEIIVRYLKNSIKIRRSIHIYFSWRGRFL